MSDDPQWKTSGAPGEPYGLKDVWADGGLSRLALLLCCLVPLMLLLGAWKVYHDRHAWQEFAAQHACKPLAKARGKTDANVGIGLDAKGQGSTAATTSGEGGKTGYLCNDGVTYWR